jgi:hypothetical protein
MVFIQVAKIVTERGWAYRKGHLELNNGVMDQLSEGVALVKNIRR